MSIEAMKLALEALDGLSEPHDVLKAQAALRQAIAEAEQDHTYGYAKGLAEAIFKQHFASDEHYASGRIVWGVNDTVIGILTQIDNMVAGMVRKPEAEQAQPVACNHKWIKTGAMEPGEARCIDCGAWNNTTFQRKPLTDEEISTIVREAAKGSAIRRDGSTSHRIARAIEARLKEENT